MSYLIGLGAALVALWATLSGQTDPLFVFFGGLSVLLALWLTAKLEIIDQDASPYHRWPVLSVFHTWLGVEIIKSNLQVIGAVLSPKPGIDPAMIDVKMTSQSDMAKTIFANAITLTPGTVTVDIDNGVLKVHALMGKNATFESFAEMERRGTLATDGKPKDTLELKTNDLEARLRRGPDSTNGGKD